MTIPVISMYHNCMFTLVLLHQSKNILTIFLKTINSLMLTLRLIRNKWNKKRKQVKQRNC